VIIVESKKGLKFSSILIIILLLVFTINGCRTKETHQDVETKIPEPVRIAYRVYCETFWDDDGYKLLDLKITYPEIISANNSSIDAINEYYQIQFDHFISSTLSEGLELARENREDSKAGGFEFRPHYYEYYPDIKYNRNNLLSVLNTFYEYTGGAHPLTAWKSQTFDIKTGKKLALTDIFKGSKDDILQRIYQLVLTEIKGSEGTDDFMYFQTYEEDLRKYYGEEDFVLTEESVLFYYQVYSIAPYAAGIPVFALPYKEADSLAISIPKLPVNEQEKELYIKAGRLIEQNKIVFFDIFGLSMLNLKIPENPGDGEVLFPVEDERFTTFLDFDNFIRSIYVQVEANSLIGNGRYFNIEGDLYADMSTAAGMGYYVNWNDYSYEISDITETSALLTINTTEDSPAGKHNIVIKAKILKENGDWLLEKMFH